MADFIKALNDGLDAAKASERARREIDEVFSDLNRQLELETGGRLSIVRKDDLKYSSRVMHNSRHDSPWNHWTICALNPSVGEESTRPLAKWLQDRFGYPCRILSARFEWACEDRAGLENALAELLRDPFIAETMYVLLKLETLPKPDSSDESQTNPEE